MKICIRLQILHDPSAPLHGPCNFQCGQPLEFLASDLILHLLLSWHITEGTSCHGLVSHQAAV